MSRCLAILLAMVVLVPLVDSAPLSEENITIDYTLGPGTSRNTILSGDARDLTYNIRPGVLPQVYKEGDSKLDWMIVNKPPTITDTLGIFDYSQVESDVAWSVMTVNLSAVNATVKFERTIDFTNTQSLDLDLNVNLSFNYIKMNSTTLAPFNVTAKMTLRNLNFTAVRVLEDGTDCTDCTVLQYTGGTAMFLVDPSLSTYSAEELAGWITWNMLDLAERWVGFSADNQGVIIIGEEGQTDTMRQFYSSNASDPSKAPLLEVNYTIRDQTFFNNLTYTDVFDLDDYFWDADADGLTFATSDDHPNVQIDIDSSDHTVDMGAIDNWNGTEYVVFTAYDNMGGLVSSNNVTLMVIMGVTSTTTSTTTTNAPPIVGAVEGIGAASDEIVLIPGDAIMLQYNATLYDADGCNDIDDVNAVMWDGFVAVHNDPTDNRWLYSNGTCDWNCAGDDGFAMCAFNVLYYADNSTQWHVNITAWDGSDWGYNVSQSLEILDMAGMNISVDEVLFTKGGGDLTLDDTRDQTNIVITNLGNVRQDAQVSGNDLSCTIGGAIPVGNMKYDTNVGDDYATMCGSLTTDGLDTCDELDVSFNLVKTNDGTPSQKTIYWRIMTPASGVGGICNGTLYVDSIGE